MLSQSEAERESKAFKALSVTVRRDLFNIICRRGPLDVKELIAATGMKEPTIRHHLLVLERAELIRTSELREGNRGRPRQLVSTTNAHWALGFPRRQYYILAEHLLKHVIEREGARGAAKVLREIGQGVAKELLEDLAKKKGSDTVEAADIEGFILPALDQMGSVVDAVDGEGSGLTVQMRNCIFFELAKSHHGVVCQGHEAIFETLAEAMGGFEAKTVSCMAGGADRCVTCLTPKP